MCRIKLLAGAALLFAAVTLQAQVSARVVAAPAKPYGADRILVQPKSTTSLAALEAFHARQNSHALTTFHGIRNLQVVAVPPGETVEGLIAKYQQSGLVEFAEPDYLGQLYDTVPNETAFADGTLWGLTNISAPQGWDVLTGATNIVVAVVDSGIRYTHEDLASNMWVSPFDGSHGWNALNGNNNPIDGGSTHGTFVAGVLGAVGNNGVGVVGVAWRVQMMACACFNSFNVGNVSDVVTCLAYAQTNGARIINASWGFTNSLALSNAMVSLRDAGIIVVAASGNSAANIDLAPNYPAGYGLDNVVSVASTSISNTLSTTSNYGTTNVYLAAPGEQIYSTFSSADNAYYPFRSGQTLGGTSFSAPYVAGACALLMAQYPTDTYRDTIARLLSSTDPLPTLAGKCRTGGRLNLAKALRTIRVAAIPSPNNAVFQLRVAGGLNRSCMVEASTNLISWSPVFTNTASTNGTFDFTDGAPTNRPFKFYRATASP